MRRFDEVILHTAREGTFRLIFDKEGEVKSLYQGNHPQESGELLVQLITDLFHVLFYNSRVSTWNNSFWCGNRILKCAFDNWIIQEIIWDIKPDLIIEAGTYYGGGTLFYAHLLDIIGKGKVFSIDIEQKSVPKHDRIIYHIGSSLAKDTIDIVSGLAKNAETVLVNLDSQHIYSHVLKEMKIYSKFVTPGSYMIVEDSNVNGHPILPNKGDGPYEAINKFLAHNSNFEIDYSREKYYLTFNPNGYLRKKNETNNRNSLPT